MAITINSTPSANQSVHEDLWFVVSSTNTSQTSFKYVFDVYIGANLVARIKSFPQPVTAKGLFNASAIVRNYINNYFTPNTSSTLVTSVSSDIRVPYTIQFGEEYGGTLYTNLANGTYNAYNYYPNILDGIDAFNGNFYGGFRSQLLTRRDKQNYVTRRDSGRCFTSILNTTENTNKTWYFTVTRYNSGVSTSSTGGNVTITDFALLDLSPTAINAYLSSSFITSATDYYTIEAFETSVSKWTITVYILCEPRYDAIPIHFLNSLGGYDTLNFSLVNREQRTIERKSYEEIDWQNGASTMNRVNSYRVFYGGAKPFATAQTITYTLTSDWLNQTEYNWVKELIASPEVYLDKSGYYYPVKVNTNSWQEKKKFADKNFNLTLEVEVGKAYSQFR